jgi:sulfur-carrier protein
VIVHLRLFGPAAELAGASAALIDATTVADVRAQVSARYGSTFAELLERSRIWVNGEPAEFDDVLSPDDEVAILPPVSGGS